MEETDGKLTAVVSACSLIAKGCAREKGEKRRAVGHGLYERCRHWTGHSYAMLQTGDRTMASCTLLHPPLLSSTQGALAVAQTCRLEQLWVQGNTGRVDRVRRAIAPSKAPTGLMSVCMLGLSEVRMRCVHLGKTGIQCWRRMYRCRFRTGRGHELCNPEPHDTCAAVRRGLGSTATGEALPWRVDLGGSPRAKPAAKLFVEPAARMPLSDVISRANALKPGRRPDLSHPARDLVRSRVVLLTNSSQLPSSSGGILISALSLLKNNPSSAL